MCKTQEKEPRISDLPIVLQDLVISFAFDEHKWVIKSELETLLEIKSWRLPFWFLESMVWSWHHRRYLTTPLVQYIPMKYCGHNYRNLFDLDVIHSFLLALDFRVKNVRCFGSRELWQTRILESWRCFDSLSSYYKMLLRSKNRVLRFNTPYEERYVMGKPTKL